MSRLRHLCTVIVRPVWQWLIVGLLGFAATVAFLRDELLPPELAQKFKLLAVLQKWRWYWWVILALISLILVMLEGSYHAIRKTQCKLQKIGLSRSLAFVKINLDRVSGAPGRVAVSGYGGVGITPGEWVIERISIEFENTGDVQLRWSLKELEFYLGDTRVHFDLPPGTAGYIDAHRSRTYSGDLSPPVGVLAFPIDITVKFRIEYDNVPPVRPRITGRTVKYTFRSFAPVVSQNVILDEVED